MPTTRYFDVQVLRKRTYLTVELCRIVVASPIRREVQRDAGIRRRSEVTLPDNPKTRILRVVAFEDSEPIHKAFLDQGLRKDAP